MSAFDVELAALPAAKAETDQVHGRLQTALGDVTAKVTSLLGSGWSGPAATAYQQAFEDWQDGARDVLAALATMSGLLATTEQEYAVTDAGASERMQRLGGRLS
ncbi:WXG100 family type VII secretion target [Jatrophihabitans sp. YIM 134969]